MKALAMILLAFMYCPPLFSQECPYPIADTACSQNNRYYVTVSGLRDYGVPVGVDTVALYDVNEVVIWSKEFKGVSANPIVSNIGDVAVTNGHSIRFYNRMGDLKGVFTPSDGFMESDFESLEAYSATGKYFYAAVGPYSGPGYLLTLSDSGKVLNRQSLSSWGAEDRLDFVVYNDKLLVFDRAGFWRPDYLNSCCVFNETGHLIWRYKERHWGRYPLWYVRFNPSDGLLTINDNKRKERIKIDTLGSSR
jgi:hypothetical protein